MSESEIQQLIQIEGPHHKCILMRNNSGALKDATGRVVRYGLGNISTQQNMRIKSSDLIGFTEVKITPDMVGKTIAVFTAVEVKDPKWKLSPNDKRAQSQLAFIDWIKSHGGIAGFCNSVESFKELLGLHV